MCSPAILETYFSNDIMTKIHGLFQLIIICTLHNVLFPLTSYTPINKFYSFVNFSLLINAVILLMNYLVLTLYIHFLSLRHFFLHLNIIWTFITALKIFQSLYCYNTSISHGIENYFPRLWGTGISDAIFNNKIHPSSPLDHDQS